MKGLKEYTILKIRTGLCAVMLICCAVMIVFLRSRSMNQDTAPPKLSITEGDIEYTEGDDVSVLLQGVSAEDDVDGDVTESIRIRNIHYSDDSEYAIVTYVAKDSSNNIGIINNKVIFHRLGADSVKTENEVNTGVENREVEQGE